MDSEPQVISEHSRFLIKAQQTDELSFRQKKDTELDLVCYKM
jgi:hypothetical protein